MYLITPVSCLFLLKTAKPSGNTKTPALDINVLDGGGDIALNEEDGADDEEDGILPLQDTRQIEEFHFYCNNNTTHITQDAQLKKLKKDTDKLEEIWVGYRKIDDLVDRKGVLELAPWYAILADLRGKGTNVLQDYFIETKWKSQHLEKKWNQFGYNELARHLRNADAAFDLADKIQLKKYGE
jgi:hypothetical protein